LLAASVLLLSLAGARAQLPAARLDRIFPPGGQAGQTVEVTLGGENLDGCTRLIFSHPGLTAEPTQAIVETTSSPVPFRVTIQPDVPPGLYEVQAQGRLGLSNPRRFVVGADPEVRDNGSNHEFDQAQELAFNQVLNGMADGQAIDYYRVALKGGQPVTFVCKARLIDSQMEPVLVLYDADRTELARERRSGVLEWSATDDVNVVLAVHDFLFEGGGNHAYRLAALDRPRVDFAVPAAVEPGQTATVTLYGHRLPGSEPVPEWEMNGAPLERVTVEVAVPDESSFRPYAEADAAEDARALGLRQFTWHWTPSEGVNVPVRFDQALAPVVIEAEPNNQAQAAQVIELPVDLAGRLYPRGDVDWYEFETEQGGVYWIDTIADRKGSEVNPFFLLQRVTREEDGTEKLQDVKELYKSDENLGGKDYDTTTGDVNYRFEAAAGARYRILIDDLYGHARPSPAQAYRLCIRQPTPDYELAVVPVQPLPDPNQRRLLPWTVSLRQGETWPVRVIARRQDAFFEPIHVRLEGLPEGMESRGVEIPRGQNFAWLYITAAPDAQPWAGPVKVVGRAEHKGRTVEREASSGTVLWPVGDFNNESVRARLSSQFCVAVIGVEAAPLRVAPAEARTWEAPVAGKLEIPLKIERHGDFNQAFKLKPVGHPRLAKLPEIEVKEREGEAKLVIDLAEQKLEEGEYEFALFGGTKGKYRNQPEVAERARASANQAGEEAARQADALKKADEALQSARKALEEAEAKLKSARDQAASASEGTKDQVQEAVQQAETLQKQQAESVQATEAARQAAEEASKQAEAAKKAAEDQAKAAEERAKPKDVELPVYSDPIRLKVVPAPAP